MSSAALTKRPQITVAETGRKGISFSCNGLVISGSASQKPRCPPSLYSAILEISPLGLWPGMAHHYIFTLDCRREEVKRRALQSIL